RDPHRGARPGHHRHAAAEGDMNETERDTAQATAPPAGGEAQSELARWRLPALLIVLTFASMLYVGGFAFAISLFAILFAHEMGQYIAAKIHRVDVSPPYFIPVPFFLLGTMGAVINMRGAIKTRNALLDIGAAGPLAGMVVALPVLIYGLHTSPVEPLSAYDGKDFFVEGRNLLYLGILHLLKGPIPADHDVWINPIAMAGWA